jgi:16S rRNA C1402 (ribose-2'-O) methylase RsmI
MWWESDLFQNLVVAVVSSFFTYVGFLKTKEHKREADNKALSDKLQALELKSVTESRVRELIAEDTSDLRDSTATLNKDIKQLTELIANLRVDLGILNYIKGTKQP